MRIKKAFFPVAAIAHLLLLVGCSSETEQTCKKGELRDCRCKGGGYGIQDCIDTGGGVYSWGTCYDCIGVPDGGVDDGGVEEDGGNVDTCSVQGVTGSPCAKNDDCVGLLEPFCMNNAFCDNIRSYVPTCDVPGGYCTMYTTDMSTTIKCGPGAFLFNGTILDPRAQGKACIKCCRTDNDCRTTEGYYCESKVGGGCLPAFAKGLLP